MLGPETPALVLRSGTTLPIADWDAMHALEPPAVNKVGLDAFWSRLARSWLETLRTALDARYAILESDRFLMLSSLDESRANVVLEFVESTRKRILMLLDGVAADAGVGKICVLIVDSDDRYYEPKPELWKEGVERGQF